jgi:hypothetical protein
LVVITIKSSIDLNPSDMRSRFAEETKVERDLVLAYAFSNTKLLG